MEKTVSQLLTACAAALLLVSAACGSGGGFTRNNPTASTTSATRTTNGAASSQPPAASAVGAPAPVNAAAAASQHSGLPAGCLLVAQAAVTSAVSAPVGPPQFSPAQIGGVAPLLSCIFPVDTAGVTGSVRVSLSSAATSAFTKDNIQTQASRAIALDTPRLTLQPLDGVGEVAASGCEQFHGQQPLECVVLAFARGRAVTVEVTMGGDTATAGRAAAAKQLAQQVIANDALFTSTDFRLWGMGDLTKNAQITVTAGGQTATFTGGLCVLDTASHTLRVRASPSQLKTFDLLITASPTDNTAPLVGGNTYTSGTLDMLASSTLVHADTSTDPQSLSVTLHPDPAAGGTFSGRSLPSKATFSGSFTCR
jgi:hypothetical protein